MGRFGRANACAGLGEWAGEGASSPVPALPPACQTRGTSWLAQAGAQTRTKPSIHRATDMPVLVLLARATKRSLEEVIEPLIQACIYLTPVHTVHSSAVRVHPCWTGGCAQRWRITRTTSLTGPRGRRKNKLFLSQKNVPRTGPLARGDQARPVVDRLDCAGQWRRSQRQRLREWRWTMCLTPRPRRSASSSRRRI